MKKKEEIVCVIARVPRLIELGVHYCEEHSVVKTPTGEWSWTGPIHKFFYAYDLTGYHVSNGPTATAAIERLIKTLWGTEILTIEKRREGKVQYDSRRFPAEIARLRSEIKKWKGHVIKKVDWRMWLSAQYRERLSKLERTG